MPQDDPIAAFRIDRTTAAPQPGERLEPTLAAAPTVVDFDGGGRLDLDRTAAAHAAPRSVGARRLLLLGMLASLALHLSPLLLLLSWNSAPAEIAAPIPVQLVMEPPPPEPPPAEKKPAPPPSPPPPGRIASVDMGEPTPKPDQSPPVPDHSAEPTPEPPTEAPVEKEAAAAPPPPPPPELVSPLPKPAPPPDPLSTALPQAPSPKRAIRRTVAARPPPRPHPGPPAQIPGPAATRDEYLAYISALINRHSDYLAPSLLGGRSGVTVISIMVLGDGTIARIAIKRGSGYPDIDLKVEQMVAAAHRFPPLPQWIQGPSVMLDYHRVFPARVSEH